MRNNNALFYIIACILCLISSLTLAASTTITNPAAGSCGYWGEDSSSLATLGQTFIVPAPQVSMLDSVTLYVNPRDNEAPYDFAFYVYEWGGTRITGDCLFSSGKTSASGSGGYFIAYTFSPDVQLQTDTSYIWFVSSSEFFDGLQSRAVILSGSGINTYAPGRIAWADNGNDFGMLKTTDWTLFPENSTYIQDLAFTMVFTPEPATLFLLTLGGLALRRKRGK